MLIVRANQNSVANNHRRRFNLIARLESPKFLPGRCVDSMQPTAQVANVNDAIAKSRGRFADWRVSSILPIDCTIIEIERCQLTLLRADENSAADNRRGRLNRISRLVS